VADAKIAQIDQDGWISGEFAWVASETGYTMDPALRAGAAPCPAIVTIVMTGKVESGVDGLDGDAFAGSARRSRP
jgi:hypothetical protein